jgi:hypothetical protein
MQYCCEDQLQLSHRLATQLTAPHRCCPPAQLTDAQSLRVDQHGQPLSRQQFHARVTELLQRSLAAWLPPGSSATIRVSSLERDTLQVMVVARQPVGAVGRMDGAAAAPGMKGQS